MGSHRKVLGHTEHGHLAHAEQNTGFSAKYKFFNRFDVAPVAGDGVSNEIDEEGFNEYLENKGQKLLDTYEISLYAKQGKPDWNKDKGTKFWVMGDHVTHATDSASQSGQNLIFGTKPIPVLVPYVKNIKSEKWHRHGTIRRIGINNNRI